MISEALLADLGQPSGSAATEKLFQIYSFMVGIGGIFGYLITSLDWKSGASFLSHFGANTQEERVFFIVSCLFVISLIVSMKYAHDSPPISNRRVRLDSKTDIKLLPCDPTWCPYILNRLIFLFCPTSFLRILNLPKCLKRLCVYQFFAWTSLMSYSLFFTDFVGEAVYNGDPSPDAGKFRNELYDEGNSL